MPIPKAPGAEMPFLDHLEELRWRLIYSLGALFVGIVIGAVMVWRFKLLNLMQRPIEPYLGGNKLIFLNPTDPFSIMMQLALVVGLALAMPVIVYQVWAFLSPALHKHEKRVLIPILFAATILFAGGVALAYFFVVPLSIGVFYSMAEGSLTAMYEVRGYFGFVINLCLVFGLSFEVPLAIVALSALGLVRPEALARARKYAVVVVFAGSAFITPGDFLGTTIALAIPLYFLYELAVGTAFLIDRHKRRKARAELAGGEAHA